MAPPTPQPKAIFGTSFGDTKKLLTAVVDYLDRNVANPLRGEADALNAVITRESKEHPTFWRNVADNAIRAYQEFKGESYYQSSSGVALFDEVISNMDVSLLDAEENAARRLALWVGGRGVARSQPPREASVPPPSAGPSSDSSTPPLFTAEVALLPSTPSRRRDQSAPPPASKGKGRASLGPSTTPREDPIAGTSATAGDALIAESLRRMQGAGGGAASPFSGPLRSQPTPRPQASDLFGITQPRPATSRSHTLAPTNPFAPALLEGKEDDGDHLLHPLDDTSPIQDDVDFVASLLERPAAESRQGPVGTELGQRIFNRTQAWRMLSEAQVRQYALRSNAPLPLDVRKSIIRGEPVDYGKIPLYNPSATFTRPLGDASLGLVMEAATPSTKIRTFSEWLDAHTKVVAYTLSLYEFRSEEFHTYTFWMRERATRTPQLFHRYIEFDHHVRHHLGMSTYPDNLADAPLQFDLLNEIVHHPSNRASSSSSTAQQPTRTAAKRSYPPGVKAPCRRWNNEQEHEEDCDWSHRCSTCDSTEHTARKCNGSGGGGRGAKKQRVAGGGGGAVDAPGRSLRQ